MSHPVQARKPETSVHRRLLACRNTSIFPVGGSIQETALQVHVCRHHSGIPGTMLVFRTTLCCTSLKTAAPPHDDRLSAYVMQSAPMRTHTHISQSSNKWVAPYIKALITECLDSWHVTLLSVGRRLVRACHPMDQTVCSPKAR